MHPLLIFLTLAVLLLFIACIRILYVLIRIIRRRKLIIQGKTKGLIPNGNHNINKNSKSSVKTLIILGSGGHTGEMIQFTQGLNRNHYSPLIYIHADTDKSSRTRIETMETKLNNTKNIEFHTIPRSREVGQSYFTSIFTTLYSILYAFKLIYDINPEVILCNGPGTALPLVIVGFLYRCLLFRPCTSIFVESWCRVETLSLCGKLLYYCVDRFIVLWPELTEKYRLAEYVGRLI